MVESFRSKRENTQITHSDGEDTTEKYLNAFGSASQAARNGEMTFVTNDDSKAVRWAATHAYKEMGYTEPGRSIPEEFPTPDPEEYLSVYKAARLRIEEGHSDIVLPVRSPYERPDLRSAVVDASKDAGVSILDMQALKPKRVSTLQRLLRIRPDQTK
jgi:hypothetical protein